jgi:hypothetical protein
MNEKRYMKNPDTGVIFAYRAEDMRANKKLVECTADGVVFGKSTTPTDELYARIAELEQMVYEKDIRIQALESYINKLETQKREFEPPQVSRRRELEELRLDDIKTIAAKMGLNTDGRKSDIIESIIAAEKTTE